MFIIGVIGTDARLSLDENMQRVIGPFASSREAYTYAYKHHLGDL